MMPRSSDLTRLFQHIVHLCRPALTSNVPDETGNISRVQAQFNNVDVRELNSMQLVGFTSVIPAGSDVMALNVAGDNSNGVIIASNHQTYRPKNLMPGETQLYDCQSTQQSIYLKSDGSVSIAGFHNITVSCDTEVTITAPTVTVMGDLHVSGAVIAGYGGDDQVGLQTHTHGSGGPAPTPDT